MLANLFDVAVFSLVPSAARSLGDSVAVLLAGDGGARWQTHLRPLVRYVTTTAAVALFFLEWTMINVSIVPQGGAVRVGAFVVVIVVGVVGWRLFAKAGRRASQRFHEALTAEERQEGLAATMAVPAPSGDVHSLVLGPGSPAVGGTVVTLNIRAKTGASVVAVVRDGQMTRNVGPEWEFRIGDKLLVLGDAHQLAALKDLLGVT